MKRFTVLFLLLTLLLGACTENRNVNTKPQSQLAGTVEQSDDEQMHDMNESLQGVCTEKYDGEYVFSVAADTFISEFNLLCKEEFGADYLSPVAEWMVFDENSIFTGKDAVRYEFKTSQGNYIEPTIWIYASADDNRMIMLSIQFDDHGYAQWAYEVYHDYARYTLKAFLGDLNDEEIEKLFDKLNDTAYSNACYVSPEEQPYPMIVYHRGNIGLFSYYRSGMVHLCVIPVSKERLDIFINSGSKLIETGN